MKKFNQFLREAMKDIRPASEIQKIRHIVRGQTASGQQVRHEFDARDKDHAKNQFRSHYKKLGDNKAYIHSIETETEKNHREKIQAEAKPRIEAARKAAEKSMKKHKGFHDAQAKRYSSDSKINKDYKGD